MVEKENILTRVHDKGLEAKAPIKQQQRQQQQIAVKTDLYYTNLNKVEQSITDDQRRELEMLQLHRDCSNFLSVAQIYLDSNALLREPLQVEHIKSRLLGHFGTCPGINLVYGHCNYLIRKHEDLDMFLVVGPGHGAPAVLANLYLEGSLHAYYPKYTFNEVGVNALARDFSRYGGFPSHLNPMLPGTIHEGGELGYALGVSFGAVLNNPDLIVTCIVGDGECETGPTATAWHAHKFIDPKASGAVIPIVHLNGFKISSRTLYGTMSDEDLIHLFIGYGYQPRIVGNDISRIDLDMADSMEWALGEIRNIQKAAREGNPIFQPRWPMIIMKTPKGWTGIKELHHLQIEGSFRSHQVPAPNVTEDEEEFAALEKWLRSYNIDKLFDEKGAVRKEIRNTCPKKHRRMGCNHHTRSEFQPLTLPDIRKFAVDVTSANRGKQTLSATQNGGKYLAELWELNKQRFKIFSPDELASNKLDAILKVSNRNFQWDKATAFKDGGVIEILSEHTCQALLQGYILTGRYGIFPSYEAFLGIIGTMMTQFAKFMKISSEVVWRNPIPSLTYIESSTLWRQEHNGFSHQNPGFINTLINMKADIVRVYLPPDANCFLSTINHCMRGKDYINLVISTKNDTSTWLTMDEAIKHCRAGASVWKWAGNEDENYDPDVVLVGIGNEVTTEIVAAARLLIKYVPGITVRVVNVTDLMILETKSLHPHGLSDTMFNSLFTANKPVIVNFHGYPSAIKQLLFGRKHVGRFCILGYQEEGTTTTPFHMLTSNKASRFDICIEAIRAVTPHNPKVAINATAKVAGFQHVLREHHEYILKHNADPPGLAEIMNPINRHVDF